jgi:uncharacterized protein (TIGR02145 family)
VKKFSFLIASLLFALCIQAQAPQKFSYQTVVRNASNELLVEQTVGIKISIIQGSANGSPEYSETHAPQTNTNGLATLEIGGGSLLTGNFANINWANGPFFVKTETDPNGGNNYTITNTSQLLSVPYALYAASAGNNAPGLSAYQIWLNAGNSGNEATFLASLQGPQGNPASDDQNLSVSLIGDTLYLQNGGFVIIPGISIVNNTGGGQIGITQHTCGATNVHNPDKTYDTMTDQQGNVYKTIVIGTQEWMAENLKTTIYRNGNSIANITNTQWAGFTSGAWASYNNDSQYDCPYGKLYNWYAVADSRNLCPTGWHVPANSEWTTLTEYIGGGSVGGKMKTTGTQYWISPNFNATNESGFSGLPGGVRTDYQGPFGSFGLGGGWWSSSEFGDYVAWSYGLSYNNGSIGGNTIFKEDGYSVRCLRD